MKLARLSGLCQTRQPGRPTQLIVVTREEGRLLLKERPLMFLVVVTMAGIACSRVGNVSIRGPLCMTLSIDELGKNIVAALGDEE